MENQLQSIINTAKLYDEIKLEGEIKLEMPQSSSFFVGKSFSKNLINITKPNVTIDGSGAVIRVDIVDELTSDTNIFFISSMAKNVEIKNLKMYVYVNTISCIRQLVGIYNSAYGLKLTNCHIEIISENQANLAGVYNNGNLETTLETRADNMVIDNCYIRTQILNSGEKESTTYGIYNNLANSISVQNTFIYSTNKGTGSNQKAIGLYNNGRYSRINNNNIKANGSHNKGKEIEQAYTYGMIDEGNYSLISSNNIVAEWGGKCTGLVINGEYIKVNGNKILATHTMIGRVIESSKNNNVFDGNILTTTSKNPRMITLEGNNCIITNNYMEELCVWPDYRKSCGIYNTRECKNNIIKDNIIRNIQDVGIFIYNDEIGIVKDNIIVPIDGQIIKYDKAYSNDMELLKMLDESNIQSIYE